MRVLRRSGPSWEWRWAFGPLLATAGLFRLSQNAAQTTFPLLGHQALHLGAGSIGLLGTLLGIASVAATVAIGAWVPTTQAARAIAIGTALLAVSLVLFATAGSVAALAVACVVVGLAGGAGLPSLATEAGRTDPGQRDRALARYTFVLSTSLAIGPLAETGMLALSGQNVRIPFWVLIVPVAAGLTLGVRRRRVASVAPMTSAAAVTSTRARLSGFGRGGLLGSSGGRIALTVQLLYAVPFSALTVFGALIARQEFGLNAAGTQLAFSAFFVTSLLSRFALTLRSPIPAKNPIFVLAVVCTVAGMLLLAWRGPPLRLFLAMTVLGIAHGVTFPLALVLVAQSVPHDALAAANASLFAATNLVSVSAPIILGVIADAAGYPVMSLVVLAPVLVFTAVLSRQAGLGRASTLPAP